MSEKNRLFVLGAQDPEMVAIETLLRGMGERICFACDENHKRVHPGNAYKAAGALVPRLVCAVCGADASAGWCQYCNGTEPGPSPVKENLDFVQISSDEEVILVECRFDERHPLQPGRVPVYTDPQAGGPIYFPSNGTEEFYGYQTVSVADHHREGDPGYGWLPEVFWLASSLGQVAKLAFKCEVSFLSHEEWERIEAEEPNGSPLLPHEPSWFGPAALRAVLEEALPAATALMVAAADHCLESAYRGKCPGVDPDDLMRWRIETRAAFQKRPIEAVLADVEAARKRLRDSVAEWTCPECGGSMFDPHTGTEQCQYCGGTGGGGPYKVARFDGLPSVPELPEAAAREGIPFVATVKEKDGREKVVLQAASPELVKRFLSGEIVPGLKDYYGDPARGFAGGYVAK